MIISPLIAAFQAVMNHRPGRTNVKANYICKAFRSRRLGRPGLRAACRIQTGNARDKMTARNHCRT